MDLLCESVDVIGAACATSFLEEKAKDAELGDELLPEESATPYHTHAMRMATSDKIVLISRGPYASWQVLQHSTARHEQMLE